MVVDASMRVEIWSDVVCPWCYVGKRRFEQALAAFPHRDEVEVVWRAFELDPAAPVERTGDYATMLARKYGVSVERGQQMIDTMTAAAAEDGLDFRFDKARVGNTFDAHQLLHLAAERGLQGPLKERLLHAHFEEGRSVFDVDALVALGAEVGLDEGEAREALTDRRYLAAVHQDAATARALGATGVPFFVVDRTYGAAGAQPAELLLQILDRAWAESHPLVTVPAADACGDDGCAL